MFELLAAITFGTRRTNPQKMSTPGTDDPSSLPYIFPIRYSLALYHMVFHCFQQIYHWIVQLSLDILRIFLANGLVLLEVITNIWHFFTNLFFSTIRLSGPAPTRYQTGSSLFYDGVAVLVFGNVPDADSVTQDHVGHAQIVRRLRTLGYLVVMVDSQLSTSRPGSDAEDASHRRHHRHRRESATRKVKQRQGSILRVHPSELDTTLEQLRRQRIVLAAAIYMMDEKARPLMLDGDALDVILNEATAYANVERSCSPLARYESHHAGYGIDDADSVDGHAPVMEYAGANLMARSMNGSVQRAGYQKVATGVITADWQHAAICTRRVLPHLMHSRGRLIFVNSPISVAATPAERARAEQLAVLTRQLRSELASDTIPVSLVQPSDDVRAVEDVRCLRDCFATPNTHTAAAVEHAVSAMWPRRRYAVGWGVRLLDTLHRVMGEAIADGVADIVSQAKHPTHPTVPYPRSVAGTPSVLRLPVSTPAMDATVPTSTPVMPANSTISGSFKGPFISSTPLPGQTATDNASSAKRAPPNRATTIPAQDANSFFEQLTKRQFKS
jgi:hypothetical protein